MTSKRLYVCIYCTYVCFYVSFQSNYKYVYTKCMYVYVTAQITSDGYTIPEKAVMEHNMLSLSRIYENIYFSDLAAILHIDSTRAEKVQYCYLFIKKLEIF